MLAEIVSSYFKDLATGPPQPMWGDLAFRLTPSVAPEASSNRAVIRITTIPGEHHPLQTRTAFLTVGFLTSGWPCVPVLPGSLPEIIAVVSSAEMQELIDTEVKGLVSTSLFEPEPGKVVTVTHYTSMDTVAGSDKVSKAYAPVKHLFAGTPESLQGEVRWSRIS